MILETLQSANSIMLDSVRATQDKQALKTFKTQIVSLSTYTPQLEKLLNIMQAMKEKDMPGNILTADLKNALQTAVNNCGEKTDDHSLDASTVLALKNAIELCKNNLETLWKEAAESKGGAICESLTSLRGLLSNKSEADNLIEAIDKAKVTIPVSAKAIDTFLSNVEKAHKLVDDLHLDNETEAFVDKVRQKKATVGNLTPHVMKWIQENNLTHIMKVRF